MNLYDSTEIGLALNKEIKQKFHIENITIDSRTKNSNSLFIPIKGNRFDGHDFIDEALSNGAKVSLCCKDFLINKKNNLEKIIPVDNTLTALQKLAIFSRKRAISTTLIGITGSNGKTTLKNWCFEIFRNFFKTYASYKNYNNHIGLPLSLCNMPKDTELCILELGTNHPGEISFLAEISKPDISIVTNIGNAHIGNFRNEKSIALEKGSIFKYPQNGIALLPRDSTYFQILKKIALENNRKIYSFGSSLKCDYRINKIKTSDQNTQVEFDIAGQKIKIKWAISEIHHQYNALNILILSNILKLNLKNVQKLFEQLTPERGRGSIHKLNINDKKIVLYDESYNANPDSMGSAIKNLKLTSPSNFRKICIIGEMLELGIKSKSYHLQICKYLIESKVDVVCTMGNQAKLINNKLSEKILNFHFKKIDDLYNFIVENCKDEDRILIKGSNSVNLSLVTKKLISNF